MYQPHNVELRLEDFLKIIKHCPKKKYFYSVILMHVTRSSNMATRLNPIDGSTSNIDLIIASNTLGQYCDWEFQLVDIGQ